MTIVSWQAERVLQSQRAVTHYRTRGFIESCVYYIQVLADVSLASLLLASTETKCTLQVVSFLKTNLIYGCSPMSRDMNPTKISSYSIVRRRIVPDEILQDPTDL
jgi:hypothetical protein